ncbi:uncharacterized protein FMAN_14232 [Fusarium mangiferae]|uniref:asparaginase n=1 Tax=Fusarium mangiferae TaxID=192010 RepID=A0A1L7UBK4_FUSMA|nr:uncharacterized protein FMAN_14232 [Fusarium mangiferae]CVL08104.1 uncharacterized protein FMAN_14232 [Fusarium mangiferae]
MTTTLEDCEKCRHIAGEQKRQFHSETKERLPKIVIIATGGTIIAKGVSPTETTNYDIGAFGVEDVIGGIRSFWNGKAKIVTRTPFTLDSTNLDLRYKICLYHEPMEAMADEEIVGSLVLFRTDEMSATANFEDTVIPDGPRKRIAFTGATMLHTALSSDGRGNVVAAVNTLLDPSWTGVVMVMNDMITRPQETKKVRNRFEPGPGTYLGQITNFEPRLGHTERLNLPERIDISSLSHEDLEAGFPGAAIVPVTVDCNASQWIAAIVSTGAKIIVIKAYSTGWLLNDSREKIAKFASREDLVVVVTSRHGSATVETTGVEGFISGGDWMLDQLLPILQLLVKLGYTKEGIRNKITAIWRPL